jgi:hypothetical protein
MGLLFLSMPGNDLFAQVSPAATAPQKVEAVDPQTGLPVSQVPKLDLVIRDGRFSDATGHEKDATIANLAEYARTRLHQNIVLSPGVGSIRVQDMTLQNANLQSFFQALMVATSMEVEGHPLGGQPGASSETWAITGRHHSRRVEVFNLTGYLDGKDEQSTEARLHELEQIIRSTAKELSHRDFVGEEAPSFQFHPGAHLLIVTGTDDLVDIARKVVDALPNPDGRKKSSRSEPKDSGDRGQPR